MADELQRHLMVIHDLERAIRLWELLRDYEQGVVNETRAGSGNRGDAAGAAPAVTHALAYIDSCSARILAAKAQIDGLARGD
jgi:hypothetical protein